MTQHILKTGRMKFEPGTEAELCRSTGKSYMAFADMINCVFNVSQSKSDFEEMENLFKKHGLRFSTGVSDDGFYQFQFKSESDLVTARLLL